MCEKNHYGRKAATILLALLTALLVLAFMTGSQALAAASPSRADQSNVRLAPVADA